MSYGRMAKEERRLRGEIEALLGAAGATDAAEDARLGADVRGDELPAELRRREDRLAAIRAAKSRWRRNSGQRTTPAVGSRTKTGTRRAGSPTSCRGEPDAKAQSNFTDPESGIMKTSNDAFQQCYNAQVAADGAHQLVVATAVTANASDQGGVPVLLDEVARRSASSRRRCWRTPATTTSGTWRTWRREASTGMPPATSRMARSCRRWRAVRRMQNGLSDATAGGTCWDSAAACGWSVRRVGLGVAKACTPNGVTAGCRSQSRPTGGHHGLWRTKWPVNAGSRHPPRIYLAGRPRKLLRHDEAGMGRRPNSSRGSLV